MENKLTTEKIAAFDAVARDMNAAIKSGALYSPAHPVFVAAIRNLKRSFNDYFSLGEARLDIGVAQRELLLNGSFLEEKSDVNAETAEHLHRRGITALAVRAEVTEGELGKFVSVIKMDDRDLRASGGVQNVFEQGENFRVKVVDYSAILAGVPGQVTQADREMWQALCSAAGSEGTEGSAGIMDRFLNYPERSASSLNRVYKEAESQFGDLEVAAKMRWNMEQLARREKGAPSGEQGEHQKALLEILIRLDPALIVKIFESSSGPVNDGTLGSDITRGMPDEKISDFLSALAAKGVRMAERLIRLFGKMVPDISRIGGVGALLADNILNMSDKETRDRILEAVKQGFNTDPGNDMVSVLYKFTADRLPESVIKAGESQRAGFRRLIADFKESLKEENAARERVMLMLNVLYLENDAAEFGKIADELAAQIESVAGAGDMGVSKCVFEFFTEKMKKRCDDYPELKSAVERIVMDLSTEKAADRAISAITSGSEEATSDIAYLFTVFPDGLRERLIGAFLAEKDLFRKEKFLPVFSGIGRAIAAQVAARVMSGNAGIEALRELLKVLRITEHDTYRVTLLGLTGDKDPRVRVEAYRGYLPTKTEEIDGLFENLERENDESVREKIIEALIRTRYWEVIDRIFKVVEKNWHLRKYTLPLVKFCGDNKIVGAVPYLGKMIFKREIFGSAKSDELKCAAVVSLGLIRSPEAVENLKKAAVSDNEAIKRMCAIVLRSDSYV